MAAPPFALVDKRRRRHLRLPRIFFSPSIRVDRRAPPLLLNERD